MLPKWLEQLEMKYGAIDRATDPVRARQEQLLNEGLATFTMEEDILMHMKKVCCYAMLKHMAEWGHPMARRLLSTSICSPRDLGKQVQCFNLRLNKKCTFYLLKCIFQYTPAWPCYSHQCFGRYGGEPHHNS